jgi:putative transposase
VAQCWLSGLTDLHTRGGQDCCSACVEGLKDLPAAMAAVLPKTQGPLWRVHKVRNSLRSVPWKARRAVAAALRAIAGAATVADAEHALERFAERWEAPYPALSPSGLAAWDRLTVLFDSPPALRRALSTTKAIESLHDALRKVLKGRGAFPNAESIVKLFYNQWC